MNIDKSYTITNCIRGVKSDCNVIFESFHEFSEWAKGIVKNFPEDKDGLCSNYDTFINPNDEECSVGTIRKMRDRVVNEDDKCNSCPLYIPKKLLIALAEGDVEKFKKELFKRSVQLYIPLEVWFNDKF